MAALGRQHGALLERDNDRFLQDFDAVSVKSAARALAGRKVRLPLHPLMPPCLSSSQHLPDLTSPPLPSGFDDASRAPG